jgi:cAMP-dependent protein kinase regulator/CRP/FNR family cyclic AMP-dependent transcriptional regulator/cGMP-dependent protein kinase 2
MLNDDLRGAPLFAGLTDSELARVADLMEEKRVVKGAVLAREGEFAYHLVVVAEGTAEVTIGGDVVRTLQAGDTFGEIGVLERGRRTADVMATSPMRLLTMRIWSFNTLADEIPEFGVRARDLARARHEPTEG